MRGNLLTAAILAIFLAGPLASRAVLGGGERIAPGPASATMAELVGSDAAAREALVEDAITNSPLGKLAIEGKSRVEYDLFHYVDTGQVISGRGRWLYYVPQFGTGACSDPAEVAGAIDHLLALQTMGEGAGIDVWFTVPPDKSMGEPEHMGRRAQIRAGCKLQNGRLWRASAKRSGLKLVDHLAPMEEAALDADLYFTTDTHWNELAIALAARQLARDWLGVDPGLPDPASGERLSRLTDLQHDMLGVARPEAYRVYPDYWEQFADTVGEGVRGATIIHDSFYHIGLDRFRLIFPDGEFVTVTDGDRENERRVIAARPERLIVSNVEREFFRRIGNILSWSGSIGLGVSDANAAAAAECDWRPAGPGAVGVADADGTIPITLPAGEGPVCLRASFTTAPEAVSRLYLADEKRPRFAVDFVEAKGAERLIAVILPAEFRGRTVRFSSGTAPLNGLAVDIGASK